MNKKDMILKECRNKKYYKLLKKHDRYIYLALIIDGFTIDEIEEGLKNQIEDLGGLIDENGAITIFAKNYLKSFSLNIYDELKENVIEKLKEWKNVELDADRYKPKYKNGILYEVIENTDKETEKEIAEIRKWKDFDWKTQYVKDLGLEGAAKYFQLKYECKMDYDEIVQSIDDIIEEFGGRLHCKHAIMVLGAMNCLNHYSEHWNTVAKKWLAKQG